ncbi:MAG: phospholipase D-like domain-containing protein [bacterium]
MDMKQFDDILRITLEDHRLSRSEKRAFEEVLAGETLDERELALLRSRAFALAREVNPEPGSQPIIEWLEGVVKLLDQKRQAMVEKQGDSDSRSSSRAYFAPRDDCPSHIVSLFRNTHQQADICVFTITDDDIARAIIAAHWRGVAVRIITDDRTTEDLGSDIESFESVGIQVRTDESKDLMHHKFALFDGGLLLAGSYNWTRSAARHNRENIIVTRDSQLVTAFGEEFERLWREYA